MFSASPSLALRGAYFSCNSCQPRPYELDSAATGKQGCSDEGPEGAEETQAGERARGVGGGGSLTSFPLVAELLVRKRPQKLPFLSFESLILTTNSVDAKFGCGGSGFWPTSGGFYPPRGSARTTKVAQVRVVVAREAEEQEGKKITAMQAVRSRDASVIVSRKIMRLFRLEAELPMPASWVTFFLEGLPRRVRRCT